MTYTLPKSPTVLTILTILVLLIHLIFQGGMGYVSLFSYSIAIIYLLIFSFSFYLFLFLFNNLHGSYKYNSYVKYIPGDYSYLILILLLSLFLIFYSNVVGFEYGSFIEMRNILIGLYRADEASIEFRVLNTIGLLFFYLASYLYLFGDRYNFLCAASALMFPLLMANRNYILIFLLFVGFKFIYINNKKYFLFFLSIIFFLFNMLYVYIYDKGEGDLNLIFSTFLSLLTYIAVPLHGFSYSVDQHYNYGAYLSLPTSVVSWLGHDVDRNFLYTPYPHQTNVYTLFFSLVHDFGVIGLCISALFFGFFHSLLYIGSKRNGLFLILYIYSFYPLIMTFFDNVYTTSLGVWVYILLPVVFLKKKRINISST